MRFAQRSEGFHAQAEQQVEIIMGTTPAGASIGLSEFVARFAVRVVTLTATYDPQGGDKPHGLTVVFEEEI